MEDTSLKYIKNWPKSLKIVGVICFGIIIILLIYALLLFFRGPSCPNQAGGWCLNDAEQRGVMVVVIIPFISIFVFIFFVAFFIDRYRERRKKF